jgi:hypothetical protein
MKVRDLFEGYYDEKRASRRGMTIDSDGFLVRRGKSGGEVSTNERSPNAVSVSALPVEGGGKVYLVHDIDRDVDLYAISQGRTSTKVFKSEDKAYEYAKALLRRISK